ncbi:MAG: rod shape-determining protein RodA [Dehalococcoidia bacterium]|nr:rod shape-determining protein RodA [Dehalococcoidia bacterium]
METKYWRHFDYSLVLVTLVLLTYGLAMIYSASLSAAAPEQSLWDMPVARQAFFALGGLVAFVVAVVADYRILRNLSLPLYLAILVVLLGVEALGAISQGARRWLDLGVVFLQPSEFAKLVLIIALASFFSQHQKAVKSFTTLLLSIAILVPPLVLIYIQPNLGTVVVFAAVWLGIAVMSGARLLHLAALGLLGALSAPLAYFFVMQDYMRERIRIFFNPALDPLGAGYNVLQAEISIGSGGLLGKGFAQGTQSQLHYLRIQFTDFIFSVIGEELGFVGALILFGLFILLLWRCLRAATLSRDAFGRLVATGIVSMLLFQIFLNIGVNLRILPVTGVPLPLISYGGSSLLTVLLSLGILESIIIRHKKIEF